MRIGVRRQTRVCCSLQAVRSLGSSAVCWAVQSYALSSPQHASGPVPLLSQVDDPDGVGVAALLWLRMQIHSIDQQTRFIGYKHYPCGYVLWSCDTSSHGQASQVREEARVLVKWT